MKIHFREKYGTKGEEILYVTPAGKYLMRANRVRILIVVVLRQLQIKKVSYVYH